MTVRWTLQAAEDLRRIRDYIHCTAPDAGHDPDERLA
jgi:plasmid stabilization system protein ParE